MTSIHNYFRTNRYILIGIIVLFTILTLSLTLLPIGSLHLSNSIVSHDKLGHFLLFGGWTFLIGYYRFCMKPDETNLIRVLVIGIIFGGCVELLQKVVPFQRDPTFLDWFADAVGAFCSVSILYFISKYIHK